MRIKGSYRRTVFYEKIYYKNSNLILYLTFFLCLSWTGLGYCENYYPDGFDGAKWGMSLKEVFNVIQNEGKKVGWYDWVKDYEDWVEDRGARDKVLDEEVNIHYFFSSPPQEYWDIPSNMRDASLPNRFAKLIGVGIWWGHLSYKKCEELKDALKAKYGEPSLKAKKAGSLTTWEWLWFYPGYTYEDATYFRPDQPPGEIYCDELTGNRPNRSYHGVAVAIYESGFDSVVLRYFAKPSVREQAQESFLGFLRDLCQKEKQKEKDRKEQELKTRF